MRRRPAVYLMSGLISGLALLLATATSANASPDTRTQLQTVLGAIALTESGMSYRGEFVAWPWTLNVRGKGLRFRDRETAWKALTILLANNITNVDIGAMQVNWYWNNTRLHTPWAALDPVFNRSVAQQILIEHWRKHGDLWEAVGLYHAPGDPDRAHKYRQRVARHYLRLVKHSQEGEL